MITSDYLEHLEALAPKLEELCRILLREDRQVSLEDIYATVGSDPLMVGEFTEAWVRLFVESDGATREKMAASYGAVLLGLLQARCKHLGECAHQAIEDWLISRAVPGPGDRPRTSSGLVLFIAALHNWLWVRKQQGRGRILAAAGQARGSGLVVRRGEETAEIEDEQQAIEFLTDIVVRPMIEAHSTSEDLRLGDILVEHILSERIRVAIPTPHPEPLQHLMDRVCRGNPLTRLLRTGAPDEPGVPPADRPWPRIELLLGPASSGIRRVLVHALGQRLEQPDQRRDTITEVLETFHVLTEGFLQAEVDGAEGSGRVELHTYGWLSIIGDVLWTTLSRLPELESRDRNTLWARWAEGSPGHISLAHLSGKLAHYAEASMRKRRTHELSGFAWRWLDLAKVALKTWITGRDHEVLCLGLWLWGYLGETARPRSLRLTRPVVEMSLEDLVAHWLRAVGIQLDRRYSPNLDADDLSVLNGRIESLREGIRDLPAFETLRLETSQLEVAAEPAGGSEADTPSMLDDEGEPEARILQYETLTMEEEA